MKRKNIDITFVCLPPSEISIPSPAFSYLKSFLGKHGVKSDIIYANHVFSTKVDTIDIGGTFHEGNEIFLPFLSILDKMFNGGNTEYIRALYQSSFPDLFLQDKSIYSELKNDLEKLYEEIISEVINMIDSNGSRIVGITSKFHQWIPSVLLARRIKEVLPNVIIISGGWTNSQAAFDFVKLNSDIVDFSIWGEGEIPLLGLINRIKEGSNTLYEEIPRLVFQNKGKVLKTFNGGRTSYFDFTRNLYIPDFTDFFLSCKQFNLQGAIYPIERGRGCNWNRCSFCYLAQGYDFRLKPNKLFIEEITRIIETYNIHDFFFTDNDVIGTDMIEFDHFLDDLISLREKYPKFGIRMAEVISKNLNFSVIEKMATAGFERIQIGVESISEKLLKDINKQQTVIDNFFAIKAALHFNIDVKGANIIANTPNETNEMIIQSIDNLYFFRFLLNNDEFIFSSVPLAVSNYSAYLKQIKKHGNIGEWSNSDFEYILDKRYTEDIDPFSLLDYNSTKKSSTLWPKFDKIQKYYKEKKFTYECLLSGTGKGFIYNEYSNNELIKQIDFDEDVYWFIFCFLNKKKYSIDNLFDEVRGMISISSSQLDEKLDLLSNEGLLWLNRANNEIVSVIDLNFDEVI